MAAQTVFESDSSKCCALRVSNRILTKFRQEVVSKWQALLGWKIVMLNQISSFVGTAKTLVAVVRGPKNSNQFQAGLLKRESFTIEGMA